MSRWLQGGTFFLSMIVLFLLFITLLLEARYCGLFRESIWNGVGSVVGWCATWPTAAGCCNYTLLPSPIDIIFALTGLHGVGNSILTPHRPSWFAINRLNKVDKYKLKPCSNFLCQAKFEPDARVSAVGATLSRKRIGTTIRASSSLCWRNFVAWTAWGRCPRPIQQSRESLDSSRLLMGSITAWFTFSFTILLHF